MLRCCVDSAHIAMYVGEKRWAPAPPSTLWPGAVYDSARWFLMSSQALLLFPVFIIGSKNIGEKILPLEK